MLNQIQRVRGQVDEWERRTKLLGGDDPKHQELLGAAEALRQHLAAVEADLFQVDADKPQPSTARLKEKLATLSTMIDESDHAPTRAALEVFDSLGARVEEVQGQLRQVATAEVDHFGELIRAAGIPPIVS